jgi:sporulation protein YlmC with PRC-barrel domain
MFEERVRSKELLGKVIVSEETGRKFGVVGDVSFVVESGELLHIIVAEPTKYAIESNLPRDERGRLIIPFTAVRSVGDFVIVTERDIC